MQKDLGQKNKKMILRPGESPCDRKIREGKILFGLVDRISTQPARARYTSRMHALPPITGGKERIRVSTHVLTQPTELNAVGRSCRWHAEHRLVK
jgi:hypothetical protein